ncbi:hypothetical protein [Flavobacterium sp. K5-23]|uniref:hypothetical protein n=1 Tax=Flavobacterium sp. K5-23 TaxID=2746225 RepID=UPI00200E68DD|nr:hypothetical protein [Flavobacterium sp. K5-23]UQD55140.1 hypothetical protein FLAK523_01540 [Flavobacterium sp. K5-23]
MTKYLKYLISLFLAFGLMVNDGALEFQSNAADYYQFSNAIVNNEWNTSRSKLYVFNQTNTSEKTAFLIPFSFLQFAASYSLKIPVLFKLRTLLYQKISSFTMQRLFINEMITARNSYTNLYIA